MSLYNFLNKLLICKVSFCLRSKNLTFLFILLAHRNARVRYGRDELGDDFGGATTGMVDAV